MRISEILQGFHRLQACDRMDLICRMLRHCVAYESRFLGTILVDASKDHYKSQIGHMEINANRVNYYTPFQESGMSHETCEKLCCALAVVHSDNRPVAEVIFNLLDDKKVLSLFQDCNDQKVLQDFRLLYVMAVNHPALSFYQRQLLMYKYLNSMDLIYIEKSKYSFSGSFSGSVEKSLTSELDSSNKYPPEIQFSSPAPDAYITRCEVHSVYRRSLDKRYVYMIQTEWSDGTTNIVRRTYGDFFSFQTKLLDLFPEEGGQKGKKHPRMIPFLPGKNYQRLLKGKETAEKRLPELHRYARSLIGLPDHVSRSQHVLEFFRPRVTDKAEEYPPLHKITNLYDLLESGKIRSRVFSEPMHGSPTHSPMSQPKGFPLQRASHTTSADISPSTPPRVSQTLPPPVHTSPEASTESSVNVISRRPTYPLNRKQGNSAFNRVSALGATSLSEDELASNATLTMTASQVSIAGGMSSDCMTPSSHLSSSNNSLTASIPASSQAPGTTSNNSNTLKATDATVKDNDKNSTLKAENRTVGSEDVVSTIVSTSTTQTVCARQNISTESTHPRHPVAVLQPPAEATGIPLTSSTNIIAQLMPVQQQYLVSSSPCVVTQDGHVIYSTLIDHRGEMVSSPAVSPPHLHSSIQPSINSPSPTLSGKTTPYLVTNTGYPSPQIIKVAQSYSPVPSYPPYFGSPLASPVPSPKTPTMYGSYNAVNRAPTEQESLIKWLKSLRLHKYYNKFENVTFEEMCSMSVEQLEIRGMTQGAAKKLFRKLEELKRSNFVGFRDMPVVAGMSRNPSTCSLPASLLMERGITPSSSFDGFSPTGSTCSLDKFGPMGRMTPHRFSGEHHERQHSRSSCSSSVIEDTAILKVVPLNSSQNLNSGDSGVLLNESPVLPSRVPRKPTQSIPPTPPPKGGSASTNSETSLSPTGIEPVGNWADKSVPDDMATLRPDWAAMPLNDKQNGPSQHKHPAQKISSGLADSHHIIPIKTDQGNSFQQHTPQPKPHHTPSRSRHVPVNKRNSSDGQHPSNNHSQEPKIHKTPILAHRGDHVVQPIWTPQQRQVSNVSVIRNFSQQGGIVQRVSQYPVINGAMKPAVVQPGGVVTVYNNPRLGHRKDTVPVTCFNCGKRGHLGMTCPANTMETNSPNAFHKKLETLIHSSSNPPVL